MRLLSQDERIESTMRLSRNPQPPTRRKCRRGFDGIILEPRSNDRVKMWNLGSASKVREGFEEPEVLEVSTGPFSHVAKSSPMFIASRRSKSFDKTLSRNIKFSFKVCKATYRRSR